MQLPGLNLSTSVVVQLALLTVIIASNTSELLGAPPATTDELNEQVAGAKTPQPKPIRKEWKSVKAIIAAAPAQKTKTIVFEYLDEKLAIDAPVGSKIGDDRFGATPSIFDLVLPSGQTISFIPSPFTLAGEIEGRKFLGPLAYEALYLDESVYITRKRGDSYSPKVNVRLPYWHFRTTYKIDDRFNRDEAMQLVRTVRSLRPAAPYPKDFFKLADRLGIEYQPYDATKLEQVTGVYFRYQNITASQLSLLKQLPSLEKITLNNNYLAGEQLKLLEQCKNLREIYLKSVSKTELWDVVAKLESLEVVISGSLSGPTRSLEGHPSLRRLSLTLMAKDQLPRLDKLLKAPKLEELELDLNLGAQDSLDISGLKQLKVLQLTGLKNTDANIAKLRQFTKLQKAKFGAPLFAEDFTGETLDALAGSNSLKDLQLDQCKLTTKGIDALLKIQSLEKLDISRSEVSPGNFLRLSGLKNLKELQCFAVVDQETRKKLESANPQLKVR